MDDETRAEAKRILDDTFAQFCKAGQFELIDLFSVIEEMMEEQGYIEYLDDEKVLH